ncbi:MAG: CHRD domain-containing protein [Ferruginibacter sp.]
MKKVIFPVAAMLFLASFTVSPVTELVSLKKVGQVSTSARIYTAVLSGPGDPDGMGIATFEFNQGQGTITYTLDVQNIVTATAAHIHLGAAGVNGPVVVTLEAPADGSSSGVIYLDKETIKEIRKNPSGYYVNIHNAIYPGGAVRGQIMN